jgi:DEAD/DEAH box helicase domain-containing protein
LRSGCWEKGLGLDAGLVERRADINKVLEAAWNALLPILAKPGAGAHYALDFETAHVAPVTRAFPCPVSRHFLDTTFAGLSP